jgi:MYXO-CTERM domain-containing protein
MKRLSLIGSWKRLGVQLGLLAGIGLAFVGGTEPPRLEAAPKNCQPEGMCTFKKPLFGIILDYSTSMNTVFDKNDPDPLTNTRWAGAKKAIKIAIDSDNGYLAANMILGLIRFGHDPDPNNAGTVIPKDNSGITDGQKLDVGWYDAAAPDKKYYECTNGDVINAALDALPAPIDGALIGIGTWTKGALDFTKAYIAKTKADHPNDKNDRLAVLMAVTDGEWTNATGNSKLSPAGEDPSITAGDLFTNQGIPTYVVAIGEAQGKAFADKLAMAGGTNLAIDAVDNAALVMALKQVIADVQKNVVAPVCTPGLPRIMVLLDASSSMLNVANKHAGEGVGGWEEARQALAGDMGSIFDVLVNNDANPVEDVVHLGLAVFGLNAPAEEKLIVQYGPCRKDNFAWALDPKTSCAGPGCVDPYGKPPIKWTFVDGQANPPNFDEKTVSHMPKCDFAPNLPDACVGSGTYVHQGLNLVQANIATYKAECKVDGYLYPCSDATEYINIIVTDGDYNSTDAQVKAPLEAMFAAKITTYVIGFGDLIKVPASVVKLNNMASWGSGGAEKAFLAGDQAMLEAKLKQIVETLTFDPCCKFNDCSFNAEPNTVEPDPVPPDPDETSSSSSSGDSSSSGGDSSTTMQVDPSTGTTAEPGTTTVDPGTTTVDPGTTTVDPGTTTVEPTTGDPTVPTTSAGPTTVNPTTATTGDDESAGSESESDSATTGTGDDEGCGCKVEDANSTRGLLGTLLAIGMGGFLRRRRRA